MLFWLERHADIPKHMENKRPWPAENWTQIFWLWGVSTNYSAFHAFFHYLNHQEVTTLSVKGLWLNTTTLSVWMVLSLGSLVSVCVWLWNILQHSFLWAVSTPTPEGCRKSCIETNKCERVCVRVGFLTSRNWVLWTLLLGMNSTPSLLIWLWQRLQAVWC